MTRYASILESRGYELSQSDNTLICCPFHSDEKPSLSVNIQKGVFYCFACEVKGNFATLIAEIDGISYEEAYEKVYGEGFDLCESMLELEGLAEERKTREQYIPADRLRQRFSEPYGLFRSYLEKRGIGEDTIEKYGIRCCDEGKYRNRIIIPIHDIHYNIVSICARSIFRHMRPKAMKLKTSIVKYLLFGLPFVKSKSVVLVEGEIDALYLQQHGVPAVGLMGKTLPLERIELLIRYFDYVYLAYDGDCWGRQAMEKHTKQIKEYMPVSEIRLPVGVDPNDLRVDQLGDYFGGLMYGIPR